MLKNNVLTIAAGLTLALFANGCGIIEALQPTPVPEEFQSYIGHWSGIGTTLMITPEGRIGVPFPPGGRVSKKTRKSPWRGIGLGARLTGSALLLHSLPKKVGFNAKSR